MDDDYVNWMESQPDKFITKLWLEGYAEGVMQERNGIVDLEVELPETPAEGMKRIIADMENNKELKERWN
jgi:hypothetical protein